MTMNITPTYTRQDTFDRRIKYSQIKFHVDGKDSYEIKQNGLIYVVKKDQQQYIFTIYTEKTKQWVGYFTLDFKQGKYLIPNSKHPVAHPHFLINPDFRRTGIISDLLGLYHNLGVKFVFSTMTIEGFDFITKWYTRNNIPYNSALLNKGSVETFIYT